MRRCATHPMTWATLASTARRALKPFAAAPCHVAWEKRKEKKKIKLTVSGVEGQLLQPVGQGRPLWCNAGRGCVTSADADAIPS